MSGSTGLLLAKSVGSRQKIRRNSSSSKIDIMRTIHEGEIATDRPETEATPLLKQLHPVKEESCPTKTTVLLRRFLSSTVVLTSVAQTVSLPLYADVINDIETGSDPFIAFFLASMWIPIIFWGITLVVVLAGRRCDYKVSVLSVPWFELIMAGLLAAISQVLVAFSSLPNRTPVYIQAIFLQSLMVPFTALARYILLSKSINKKQFGCIVLLFMGIGMTLIPSMIQEDSSGLTYLQTVDSTGGYWYFDLIFALSCIPLACAYGLLEKGQMAHPTNSFVITTWFKTFLCCSYVLLFWLDFLPGFGSAQHPGDFGTHISEGFKCFYAMHNSQCRHVSMIAFVYIISSASNTFLSILLINTGDGSLYTVIVLVLGLPLSTLFWTLFTAVPHIQWMPSFRSSTVFVIIGLLVIIPAIMLFNSFKQEAKSTRLRERNLVRRQNSFRTRHVTTSECYSMLGPTRLYSKQTTVTMTTEQRANKQARAKRTRSAPAMCF